jgi:hypothetical protein
MKQGMDTACFDDAQCLAAGIKAYSPPYPAEGGNINDAKMRGGSDNITAKLLRIREIFA